MCVTLWQSITGKKPHLQVTHWERNLWERITRLSSSLSSVFQSPQQKAQLDSQLWFIRISHAAWRDECQIAQSEITAWQTDADFWRRLCALLVCVSVVPAGWLIKMWFTRRDDDQDEKKDDQRARPADRSRALRRMQRIRRRSNIGKHRSYSYPQQDDRHSLPVTMAPIIKPSSAVLSVWIWIDIISNLEEVCHTWQLPNKQLFLRSINQSIN